jgi:hypothetical protein
MRSILQLRGVPLYWNQPHLLEPTFELKSNEEILGVLHFKNSFGSRAYGTTSEGEWTFKRQGFAHTYVTIRKSGEDTDQAIYRNNTWSGGGTLEFPDGRRFQVNSNYWHALFEIRNESGETVIRFTNVGGFKLHAQLDLLPLAETVLETPMLVLLGWYLAVMISRDGEIAAAVF